VELAASLLSRSSAAPLRTVRCHHLPPALPLLCEPTLQLSPLRVVRRHEMAHQRDNVPLGLPALALRKFALRLGGSTRIVVIVVIHLVIRAT
jgi:hypothetical protein